MVDPKKKRLAVARILNEGSSVETEAQRLNVTARQVRRWVEATKEILPKPPKGPESSPEKSPSQEVLPPQTGHENKPNPALQEALKAAGETSGPVKNAPPTSGEMVDAREDAAKFCLDTIGNVKNSIGSTMVSFRYSPPLRVRDEDVQEVITLSPMDEGLIRANAAELYPILLKWMKGPYQIIGGLAWSAVLMMIGLDGLAKKKGWVDAEKPPAPARPVFVPPVTPVAPAATAPAWEPPKEGVQSVDATAGPFGQVKDVPTVPSPYILPVEAVA